MTPFVFIPSIRSQNDPIHENTNVKIQALEPAFRHEPVSFQMGACYQPDRRPKLNGNGDSGSLQQLRQIRVDFNLIVHVPCKSKRVPK